MPTNHPSVLSPDQKLVNQCPLPPPHIPLDRAGHVAVCRRQLRRSRGCVLQVRMCQSVYCYTYINLLPKASWHPLWFSGLKRCYRGYIALLFFMACLASQPARFVWSIVRVFHQAHSPTAAALWFASCCYGVVMSCHCVEGGGGVFTSWHCCTVFDGKWNDTIS